MQTEGAYIHGLHMQGARWCSEKNLIQESHPKVLFDQLPVILLRPTIKSSISTGLHYKCPVYKTSLRRGLLSTTGHSTNYVLTILIPSDVNENHWINRGKLAKIPNFQCHKRVNHHTVSIKASRRYVSWMTDDAEIHKQLQTADYFLNLNFIF